MIDALILSSEPLLLALAAALYLIDCGRLLRPNESVAVATARGRFKLITASDGFRFRQRMAVFPAWLAPQTPMILVRADGEPVEPARAQVWQAAYLALVRRMSVTGWVCLLLLVELFVAVPVAFWLGGYALPLLVVLALIYLQVIGLVIWLWLKRRTLCVRWQAAALISFECLVCLPYAINFQRKVFAQAMSQGRLLPAALIAPYLDTAEAG